MDTTDLILHSSPFSTTSDPRFFYTNTLYEEGYRRLLTALRKRKGLLLLTGEPGTGKTTFLQRFSAALDETAHVTFLPCAAPTFREILSYLCEQCGLSCTGDDQWTQLTLFQEYLWGRATLGGIEALFIDEAQHLTKETLDQLRLLTSHDWQNGKLLQIILAGQPELEDKLAQPDLRHIQESIAASCRLLPLVREELGSFIQHRLRVAGYPRLEIFTPGAMQAITHYAGGIPRLINVICDAALLVAAHRGLDSVSAEIIVHVARTLQLTPFPVPQPFRESTPQTAHSLPVSSGPEPEASSDTTPLVLVEEVYRKRALATQTTLSQSTRARKHFSFFVPSLPQHSVGIGLSILLVWLLSPLLHSNVEQTNISPERTSLTENSLSSVQESTPTREHAAGANHVDPGNVQPRMPLEAFPEVTSPPLSVAAFPLASTLSSVQSTVIQSPEAPQEQRTQMAAVPSNPGRVLEALDQHPQFSRLPNLRSETVVKQPFTSMRVLPWSLGKTEARKRLASLGLTANSETLLRAAEHGYVATVDLVLRAGVSPNTQNTRGWTALMFAARSSSLDLVELLLARGANPNLKNETGATALIVAARNNRPTIAQALLRRGAVIDATDQQGWTALMHASSMGYGVTVRTLLSNGANPRLANKKS